MFGNHPCWVGYQHSGQQPVHAVGMGYHPLAAATLDTLNILKHNQIQTTSRASRLAAWASAVDCSASPDCSAMSDC